MKSSLKQIRIHILDILQDDSWQLRCAEIYQYPLEKIFGAIQYSQSSINPVIKWHGVSTLGFYLKNDPAIKRSQINEMFNRMMWNLNEESGGIGWGMAELMGESMAAIPWLMEEHCNMVASFLIENIDGPDNYLEFDPLRTGAWWSLMRMSQSNHKAFDHLKEELILSAHAEKILESKLYAALFFSNAGWETGKLVHFNQMDIPEDFTLYHNFTVYTKSTINKLSEIMMNNS